jgi:hypothetical protein
MDCTVTKYLGTCGGKEVFLNRILGYYGFRPANPAGTFPPADIVIGQPTGWDHGTANGSNTRFVGATDRTLALLPFPAGSKTANLVLGQSSFTTAYSGTAANRMTKCTGVRVHPVTGEVFVLDGESAPNGRQPPAISFWNGPPHGPRKLGHRSSVKPTSGWNRRVGRPRVVSTACVGRSRS